MRSTYQRYVAARVPPWIVLRRVDAPGPGRNGLTCRRRCPGELIEQEHLAQPPEAVQCHRSGIPSWSVHDAPDEAVGGSP